jgi:hypothetical protein
MRRLALAALLLLAMAAVPAPAAADVTDVVNSTVCMVHVSSNVPALANCFDGLVAACLQTTMEAQTFDSSMENGDSHFQHCYSYLTGMNPPCQGLNCQLACTAFGCIGTFYHYDGTGLGASRTTGVYALDVFVGANESPNGVFVIYGGGISHCRSGVTASGDIVLHDCVF